jgi:dTDP-4-amino-4,6-dideoxygalactose transaminase
MTTTQFAIHGGEPSFAQKIHMVKPVLPSFETLEPGVREILSSGMVTKGKFLREFESRVAELLDVRHVVAVSSCTSGLMLVHQGLGMAGFEVIVPSFTFMASVSSMVWAGATPVFVDVERETTNIDVSGIEAHLTDRTKAIVAVHNFGNPADIEGLVELAERHNLRLIFDAAHGLGALYDGRPVGGQGDAQVFSLSPTKLLIAGEGGLVATNDSELAETIRLGREYGNDGNYDSVFPGLNARMPELSALMGLHSLDQLASSVERRNAVTRAYRKALEGVPGLEFQQVRPQDRSSCKDFSLLVLPEFGMSRDRLSECLLAENVDSRKYYDPTCHAHTAYRKYCDAPEKLSTSTFLADHSLSLPIWSGMELSTAQQIGGLVARLQRHASSLADS